MSAVYLTYRDSAQLLAPGLFSVLLLAFELPVVFLAALQSLDTRLEDAARIDGAGPWRRVWHVILPGVAPVAFFNLLTGAIAAAQVFAYPVNAMADFRSVSLLHSVVPRIACARQLSPKCAAAAETQRAAKPATSSALRSG